MTQDKLENNGSPPADGPKHLLSFDVEEYFQVEAASSSGINKDMWGQFRHRLGAAVDKVLWLLDEHNVKATFFVLGWVAQHQKDLIKAIAGQGHELASHGMSHDMLNRLTPEQFASELSDSKAILEDIAGKPVLGYRAPTFSITHQTAWAIDILAAKGYRYDSSIFPVRHDRYGVPEAPVGLHKAQGPCGSEILEIPPLTCSIFGQNIPAAGGGYLRLFPVRFIGHALKRAQREGRPGMIYLHPWEFDPGQPVMREMGKVTRWRHRVNLHRTADKLSWLMKRFEFTPVETQLDSFDSLSLPTFKYSNY